MASTLPGAYNFAEDPTRSADSARLFWRPDLDAAAIVVDAEPCDNLDTEAFDLAALPVVATHLAAASGEQLLIGPGAHPIRLSIASGTLLSGPVRLSYRLAGAKDLKLRLHALLRLAALLCERRLPAPLFPVAAAARRRATVLRILDALAVGASHRAIAQIVYGPLLVERDWSGPSDYLRSRTHRLVREARRIAARGHVDFVRRQV